VELHFTIIVSSERVDWDGCDYSRRGQVSEVYVWYFQVVLLFYFFLCKKSYPEEHRLSLRGQQLEMGEFQPRGRPTNELFSIQDKTVIATGITGGIGFEMAQTLAEAGAHIVAIHLPDDSNTELLGQTIRSLHRQFHAFGCDVSDSAWLRSTFDNIW
jgi:hypothetical protein